MSMAIDVQQNVSIHPMVLILPHIPIRKVNQHPYILGSPKNRTEVLRWHSGMPCIKMDASMQRAWKKSSAYTERTLDYQTYLLGMQGCAQTCWAGSKAMQACRIHVHRCTSLQKTRGGL